MLQQGSIRWAIIVGVYLIPSRGSLFCGNALADVQSDGVSQKGPRESQPNNCPSDAEKHFLRVDLSYFLGSPRLKLIRDGATVGPEFFSFVPDYAVRGSSEGMRHAFHARVFHAGALVSGLTAIGLLAGSMIVRMNDDHWTRTAGSMAGGSLAAIVVGVVFAYLREREFMAAVNSYNYDLVNGRLME